jgi:hypothetical protein
MSKPITCICGYRGPSVTEGQRSVCPICRTPAAGAWSAPAPPPPPLPATQVPAAPVAVPAMEASSSSRTKSYRIPCPRGHVLKTPATMLGQQVFCPQCNEVFELREEDSLEAKRRRQIVDHEREAQQAKLWLNRAIVAAVFVALSFIVMVVIQFMR